MVSIATGCNGALQVAELVADLSGNTLIRNIGRKQSVRVGDTLDVSRSVRTVKDLATGKVIRTIINKVGRADS